MLFLVMGAVSATDSLNVQDREDSNLVDDGEDLLSTNNKLEISSEDSISQTNIVNSHDDNLADCPDDEVLNASSDSCYGDDCQKLASGNVEAVGENTLSSSNSSSNGVISDVSSNNGVIAVSSTGSSIKAATPQSVKLSVADTHYAKSATYFDVTLKDSNGNPLINQLVSLKVKGKTYSAYTNQNGIASVKTAALAVGTYSVSLSYKGNSNYSSSSLSKKVKVLSSVSGSDLTKYYRDTSKYTVKFWKNNSPLANYKVTFKINGKSYTETTNKDGIVNLKINLEVGKYKISVTNPYSKQKVSHTIVVKKEKTTIDAKSKIYIHPTGGSFSITLKAKHAGALNAKKITFTYNSKSVTSKTNANGKAKISIPALAKGTYKISYKYGGSKNYHGQSGSCQLVVANPTTKVSSSDVRMTYDGAKNFKVKLTDSHNKALANKDVKIKIKGKTTICKTDSNGIAKLSLKKITAGTYTVKYHYSDVGSKDYSHGSNKVIIYKQAAKIIAKDLTMKSDNSSVYKLTVKDNHGKVLKGIFVKTTINGRSFFYQTDSEGVAKLKLTLGAGYYPIKSAVVDPSYTSYTVTKHVLVKGYKFVADNVYVPVGGSAKFSVKVVDAKKNPVKNGKVQFTFEGKNLTSKTDSKGIAKVSLGVLSKGTHKITFTYESTSGSSKIYVVNKVSLNNVLKASKSVKNYVAKYSKLPSSVKIGDVSFSTADYLYLASKAIINLKSGNKKDISIKNVKDPSKPMAATNLGYLKDYLSVAKKVVKYADSNGQMPNSVSSKVGTIGYKGIVSAFSNVLSYYDNHKKMPSYIVLKSFSGGSSSFTGVLNTKNTIKNLAAYLAASKNCEVNNEQIKKIVAKLTKNCKSDKEKADKIFRYVRDTVSYSFYYNTKYGAYGTFKAKSGNCVDHAHILVAMYRCAGLPARYVHGTCTFSSGNTYGHVWAQVLIGNTWTVADGTSSRNSLGVVANWNTHSYKLQAYYQSLPF